MRKMFADACIKRPVVITIIGTIAVTMILIIVGKLSWSSSLRSWLCETHLDKLLENGEDAPHVPLNTAWDASGCNQILCSNLQGNSLHKTATHRVHCCHTTADATHESISYGSMTLLISAFVAMHTRAQVRNVLPKSSAEPCCNRTKVRFWVLLCVAYVQTGLLKNSCLVTIHT